MAATILSGTVTPTGNYTLYTNNTGGNVRLIIHSLYINRGSVSPGSASRYRTKRVNITGGSNGTLSLPTSEFMTLYSDKVDALRLQVGKDLLTTDRFIPNDAFGQIIERYPTTGDTVNYQGGFVLVTSTDEVAGIANPIVPVGPQSFPTEIMLRNGQAIQFEAVTSTSPQFISFNITVMPEAG